MTARTTEDNAQGGERVAPNYRDRSDEAATATPSEAEKLISCILADSHFFLNDRVARSYISFPMKLYAMLERIEPDGYSHVASWQPHGRCFIVRNPDVFRALLPRYFPGINKLESFQRQLNLYGFHRISCGADKGGYYHECFLRGRPFLVNQVHRIKCKGTGVRCKQNPLAEPNFYRMPAVRPVATETNTNEGGISSSPTSIMMTPQSRRPASIHSQSHQLSFVSPHSALIEQDDDEEIGRFTFSVQNDNRVVSRSATPVSYNESNEDEFLRAVNDDDFFRKVCALFPEDECCSPERLW